MSWESAGSHHTASGQTPPRTRMRASDADRHVTVELLQDGMTRGLLTFDEGSDRMAAAWNSRYLDELAPLTADLPPAAPAAAETAAAPGWPALAALAAAQLRHILATAPTRDPRLNRLLAAAAGMAALVILSLLAVATVHGVLIGDHGVPGDLPGGTFGHHGFGRP